MGQSKGTGTCITRGPAETQRGTSRKAGETVAKNLTNLVTDTNRQSSEARDVLRRINSKKYATGHVTIELLKTGLLDSKHEEPSLRFAANFSAETTEAERP